MMILEMKHRLLLAAGLACVSIAYSQGDSLVIPERETNSKH